MFTIERCRETSYQTTIYSVMSTEYHSYFRCWIFTCAKTFGLPRQRHSYPGSDSSALPYTLHDAFLDPHVTPEAHCSSISSPLSIQCHTLDHDCAQVLSQHRPCSLAILSTLPSAVLFILQPFRYKLRSWDSSKTCRVGCETFGNKSQTKVS